MARLLVRVLPFAIAAVVLSAASQGCSVDQTALEGCRKIEDARCEQASPCPDVKIKDAESCKRFYRDQCLHGMAIADDPGDVAVGKCVATIVKAGQCAKAGSPTCDLAVAQPGTSACGVLEHPELATDCAFLVPPAPPASTATPADGGTDAPTD